MTEQKDVLSRFVKKQRSSLKNEMTVMVILAFLVGVALYFIVHFGFEWFVQNTYLAPDRKTERESAHFSNLQAYVLEHDVGSEDLSAFAEWAKEEPYVYLMLYEDNTLILAAGTEGSGDPHSTSGITVEHPSQDELNRYAEEYGMRPLTVRDGTLLCSVADYSHYFYYNVSNVVSLSAAILAIALILILYFRRVVLRISNLSADVAAVSEGEMSRAIRVDELDDEISVLMSNVEAMRSSIVRTLEGERAAINANTELITSMSHDIRTPLTVLLGYLDVMKLYAEDETMREYLRASEKTALRLKNLSDDLFQYFVVFSGKEMEVSLQEYNAATLIDQLLTEHIVLLREHGYTIQYGEGETPEDYPDTTVVTDAPKLMRVIDNIFSNFGKYSDKNEPIKILFSFDFDNITLQFENKIAKNTTVVESTGIGLKTCARIAESIGSSFSVDSDEDNFVVVLTVPLPKKGGGNA